MEDDSDQSDSNSEEIIGPDSDSLEIAGNVFFRDKAIMLF